MKKCARRVARERIGGAHPAGLELLALVGRGHLAFGHARHEKGHVEALGQVAVGDPVREGEHLVRRQHQPACRALVGESGARGVVAVHGGDVFGAHRPAVGVVCEQHAQFFKGLADGRDGLGALDAALGGAAGGDALGGFVGRVDVAAGKNIGARRKARGGRAAGHQHLDAGGRVAQQQHGGGGAHGRGLACGVNQLGEADHGVIIGSRCDARVARCISS
jgi:hypothetical protein